MEENKIFSKVFMWMFIGLLITFGVGAIVAANENMVYNVFNNLYIWLVLAQFVVYSALTGLTFSSIFVVFELTSIMMVFGITAAVFGVFAFIGYFTKMNLLKWHTYLFMALFGLILASLINMFVGNSTADLVICSIGIVIFVIYTAYDMQKIKLLSSTMESEHKVAIIGALELYLDFINLFLYIIQLIGKNRD